MPKPSRIDDRINLAVTKAFLPHKVPNLSARGSKLAGVKTVTDEHARFLQNGSTTSSQSVGRDGITTVNEGSGTGKPRRKVI